MFELLSQPLTVRAGVPLRTHDGFNLGTLCAIDPKPRSFNDKDIAILDVLTVAGLYAMRIWAGSSALAIPVSPWLLAFCIFIFLSLAMVKRYAELMAMRVVDGRNAHA